LREALSSLADKIQAAFIFGSTAGGEFNQNSDVDVMLILAHTINAESNVTNQIDIFRKKEIL